MDIKTTTDFKITFDRSLKPPILKAFNKATQGGVIVDSCTKDEVLTPDGEKIKSKELGGLLRGSLIFMKSDLTALIRYLNKKSHGAN